MRNSLLVVLIFSILLNGCSSVEKEHYYKASRLDEEVFPELNYQGDKELTLTYKRLTHTFGKDDVQQVIISVNYFSNLLTWGPPLLPVLPDFGGSSEVNENEKLHIYFKAWSTGPYDKDFPPVAPDLEIVTENGPMKPVKIDDFKTGLYKFTFPTTIKETKKFIIKPMEVQSDGEILKVPALKFSFTYSLRYKWINSFSK